jgi:hypothetical protein
MIAGWPYIIETRARGGIRGKCFRYGRLCQLLVAPSAQESAMTAMSIPCPVCGEPVTAHWEALDHGMRHVVEEVAKRQAEDAEWAEKQARWQRWQAEKARRKAERDLQRQMDFKLGGMSVSRARDVMRRGFRDNKDTLKR